MIGKEIKFCKSGLNRSDDKYNGQGIVLDKVRVLFFETYNTSIDAYIVQSADKKIHIVHMSELLSIV